tara:strand:+ start:154 stop:372 length:219 start_codon:yes stop_codon:yes gene_type:complete
VTLPSSGRTNTFEYGLFEAFLGGSYLERVFHRRRVAEPEFLEPITNRGGRVVCRAWGMGRLNRWYAAELRNL